MAKAAFNLDGPDFEEVSPPEGPSTSASGDYCSVCGTPLVYRGRGKHPTKCAQHKGTASRSTSSGGKGKGASEKEWDRFSYVVLVACTWLLARYAAGGVGLMLKPPPGVPEADFDAYTDSLAMMDDEAKPLAKLIASRITPTELNKKVGKYIIAAVEYEDVGYALWGYGKRIGPPLVERMATPRARKQPKPQAAVQPVTRKVASTNGTTGPSNREVVNQLRRDISTPTGLPHN